ncbi:MAG: DUF6776 family protein [Thiogranum sp.]
MESRNHRILVYKPAHLWLAAGVGLVLLLSGAYLMFQRGVHYAGNELERLDRRQAELVQKLDEVGSENASLRQQLAIQQRSSEIDRLASVEVRNEFAVLQDKLQALRKELAFYRGIVSPGDNKAGLNIQRFDLEPRSTPGRYKYKLMLTQVKRNDRYVRGVIEIEVEGTQDGQTRVLPFTSLRVDEDGALNFKFRYFQDFEGEIEIPSAFKPQRLTIHVKTSGKGQPPGVDKTMEWPA